MSENKILEMINLYFDGELAKSEEADLFSLLANDQSARDHFKQLGVVRNIVDNSLEDLPTDLEERILRTIGSKVQSKTGLIFGKQVFSVISYAAAIILLFISGYLFFKVSSYQDRVENLSQQMDVQTKTIQMLYNSLPGVEIVGTIENKIVVKPNI